MEKQLLDFVKIPKDIYQHIDKNSPIRRYLIEIENKYWRSRTNHTYRFPFTEESSNEVSHPTIRNSTSAKRRTESFRDEILEEVIYNTKTSRRGRAGDWAESSSLGILDESLQSLRGVLKYNLHSQNLKPSKKKNQRTVGFLSANRERIVSSDYSPKSLSNGRKMLANKSNNVGRSGKFQHQINLETSKTSTKRLLSSIKNQSRYVDHLTSEKKKGSNRLNSLKKLKPEKVRKKTHRTMKSVGNEFKQSLLGQQPLQKQVSIKEAKDLARSLLGDKHKQKIKSNSKLSYLKSIISPRYVKEKPSLLTYTASKERSFGDSTLNLSSGKVKFSNRVARLSTISKNQDSKKILIPKTADSKRISDSHVKADSRENQSSKQLTKVSVLKKKLKFFELKNSQYNKKFQLNRSLNGHNYSKSPEESRNGNDSIKSHFKERAFGLDSELDCHTEPEVQPFDPKFAPNCLVKSYFVKKEGVVKEKKQGLKMRSKKNRKITTDSSLKFIQTLRAKQSEISQKETPKSYFAEINESFASRSKLSVKIATLGKASILKSFLTKEKDHISKDPRLAKSGNLFQQIKQRLVKS